MNIKILFVGLAIVCATVNPTELIALDTSHAEIVEKVEETIPPPKTKKQIVGELVDLYSKKYGVSTSAMMRTLVNENHDFTFDKQSTLTYKAGNRWGFPAGTREKSYGVCQIHLPDHPEISYEQAIDPDFCIHWMAKEFAQGRASQWMGYEG